MMAFIIILFAFYFVTICVLIYGFKKVKNYSNIGLEPRTTFTVIVPFRDEKENLPLLLNSFSKLNYPSNLFNVILVDDDSKEQFPISSFQFPVTLLNNNRVSNSPKKDAILTAMQTVVTDWIITTDADCMVPKNWLLTLDNYIQTHNVSMIAGAVTYNCKPSFLHQFQQLDMASLQGATMGSFGIHQGFMCNGANFAYTKSLFLELNGFEGNDGIASGDDVFLLQKAINDATNQVHYLKSKDTIVISNPLNNWKALFYQRVRWASKTGSYQSAFGKMLAIIVFAGNVGWLYALFWCLIDFEKAKLLLATIILKMVVDGVLIIKSDCFLNSKRASFLLLGSFFYPFFSSSVALYSLFGKYEWKGRRF